MELGAALDTVSMKRLALILLAFMLWLGLAPQPIALPRPIHSPNQQKPRYATEINEKQNFICMKDRRTGRTLWEIDARPDDIMRQSWSADHKSFAADIINSRTANWQVWLWRENYPLRVSTIPNGKKNYNMGTLWSPNGLRVLIRPGASAASDSGDGGVGVIWGLTFKRQGPLRYRLLIGTNVWRVKWKDNRTVLYFGLDSENDKMVEQPRYKKVNF
jgi:hypothetical protein